MSGIYIPGMEMPTSCYDCNCFIRDSDGSDYCCLLMQDIEDNNKRDDDCPLVPVPDHGDLIDRVAFREEMDKHYPFDRYTQSKHEWEDAAKSAVIKMLATAPTIIPADKEKEE